MSIEVQEISFNYGNRLALDHVSFKLQPGRFNALLGPNGAGKSTLYALLTRLFALQQGDILIDGLPLRHRPRAVMQRVGVVFQHSTLDQDLSVLQNLEYHGALHGLSPRQVLRAATPLLQRMQLDERLHDSIRSLNGGHRRRVEIARALLHNPSVLLLDEASVGLDTTSRTAINHHVRDLCSSHNLTVLWATHLIEEIELEDPVLILHHGKILADSSAASICTENGCDSLAQAFEQVTGLKESAACL